MDWDDPVARHNLISDVGIAEYNKLHAQYRLESVIEVVAGHEIRPVQTRFGRLLDVGSTGSAFRTIVEARQFAEANALLGVARITETDIHKAAKNDDFYAALDGLMKIAGIDAGDVAGESFVDVSEATWKAITPSDRKVRLESWLKAEKAMEFIRSDPTPMAP